MSFARPRVSLSASPSASPSRSALHSARSLNPLRPRASVSASSTAPRRSAGERACIPADERGSGAGGTLRRGRDASSSGGCVQFDQQLVTPLPRACTRAGDNGSRSQTSTELLDAASRRSAASTPPAQPSLSLASPPRSSRYSPALSARTQPDPPATALLLAERSRETSFSSSSALSTSPAALRDPALPALSRASHIEPVTTRTAASAVSALSLAASAVAASPALSLRSHCKQPAQINHPALADAAPFSSGQSRRALRGGRGRGYGGSEFGSGSDSESDAGADKAPGQEAADWRQGDGGGADNLGDGSGGTVAARRSVASPSSTRRVSLQARSRQLAPILTQRAEQRAPFDDAASPGTWSSSYASTLPLSSASPSASPTAPYGLHSPLQSPSPQPHSSLVAGGDADSASRRLLGLDNEGNTVGSRNTHPKQLLALAWADCVIDHCACVCMCAQCYFNSAVQCLLSIAPLLAFFSTPASSPPYRHDLNPAAGRSLARLADSFASLCSTMAAVPSPRSSSHSPLDRASCSVSAASLLRCFVSQADSFSGGGQHDSHELLRALLGLLHDALNRVTLQPAYEALDAVQGESEERQSARYWSNYTARNASVVTDLFAGQQRSEVRCLACQRVRVAFDPFLDLSLPLPPHSAQHSSAATLGQCLRHFLATELLDAVYCPHCRAHTRSSKALSLQRLPRVLVLHLKRFEFNSQGGRRKLSTPLAAPLSLALHAPGGAQCGAVAWHYSLLGTVNHLGSAHGGHYIAHASVQQTQQQSHWFAFNDQHVRAVEAAQVEAQHNQSAYVLFYSRSSAR